MRLLDLPDEVLELLEEGTLTEGHGRALLMAADHDDRRRLARRAADEGWTVRETEARRARPARPPRPSAASAGAPASRPGRRPPPDLAGRLRPRARRRRPRGAQGQGYTVTLSVASHDEAEALAQRLGAVHPA